MNPTLSIDFLLDKLGIVSSGQKGWSQNWGRRNRDTPSLSLPLPPFLSLSLLPSFWLSFHLSLSPHSSFLPLFFLPVAPPPFLPSLSCATIHTEIKIGEKCINGMTCLIKYMKRVVQNGLGKESCCPCLTGRIYIVICRIWVPCPPYFLFFKLYLLSVFLSVTDKMLHWWRVPPSLPFKISWSSDILRGLAPRYHCL